MAIKLFFFFFSFPFFAYLWAEDALEMEAFPVIVIWKKEACEHT